MKKFWMMMLIVGSFGSLPPAMAAPVHGGAALGAMQASSPVQQARVFCYNKFTGRFKHWGACDNTPRVFCKDHYSGRFLYWGACRRSYY